MGVGFPATIHLHAFGKRIFDAFGDVAYHVGSSLMLKTGWRDVDVRLILDAEKWDALELGNPRDMQQNPRWQAYCLAFTALGREMTGLPIDFQIQHQDLANSENPRASMSALVLAIPRHKE